MATVGVEEEFLLVDPVTGRLAPYAEKVRASAGLEPFVASREIQPELLQAQVEVATPVCDSLEEVGGHLLRLRHAVAGAAETHGCRILASGTPLLREDTPVPVTAQTRYKAMQRQAPQLVAEQMVNGMHVHVAVPGRRVGVEVLNRIRLWLPTLTAMAANSPLWEGHDTGFASWRTVVFDRWPVSGVPPRFLDDQDYDTRVRRLVDTGVISDAGQLYWQIRLSERCPTVEVRCLDVQLRTDDAVMFAGLVRALVDTAVCEVTAGRPSAEPGQELLRAAMWQAARHGLSEDLIDSAGSRRRAGDVVCRLLEYVSPALQASGDSREVTSLVHRLLRQGTGADRQRHALAEGGIDGVTAMVTEAGGNP
ncbi:carboxylate-amine ligase [Streptomyces chromofuscus]|uniref:Putative glutamate--cysteine ligase 2 n=1 Tax=Streptomyces chromofuscus TaxID=42881 RepID=A0A7M2T933_STRCW|nr:glutamate--cysteine ligase [Streptomyces chromofuscus]QOV45072.1 glutamate--cysteine ligase [Streptomyces chromofuscus]GGT27914.1 putative glutamate--cysteine ligase 2 [Streptomyces chromofuscus]